MKQSNVFALTSSVGTALASARESSRALMVSASLPAACAALRASSAALIASVVSVLTNWHLPSLSNGLSSFASASFLRSIL